MEVFERNMRFFILVFSFLTHILGLVLLYLIEGEWGPVDKVYLFVAIMCFANSLAISRDMYLNILYEDHQREKRISKNRSFEKPEQKYH